MGRVMAVAVAGAMAWTWTASAEAQGACAPTAAMEQVLREKYAERQVMSGTQVHRGERVGVTVWLNASTGTWSIVRHFAAGRACLIEQGVDGGQGVPRPLGDPT